MAIQLITDSTSYIPEHLIYQHSLKVVPLSVQFEEKHFLDIPDQFTSFYKELKSVDYIPKSSQPSVAKMIEVFECALKKGDDVIAVFLSSKMSGTYATACMVKEQLLETYTQAKITIIDSTSNCMQMGLCVLSAAEAIAKNMTYETVVSEAMKTIKRTRFVFSPDSLEYLRRGGRIGNAGAFVGQLLQVKPILTVKEGETTSLDKVRTRKKSIRYITDLFLKDIESYGLNKVVIHHIEADEDAQRIKKLFEDKCAVDHIEIISIGPVIGTHVGPGAIGIAYEVKEAFK